MQQKKTSETHGGLEEIALDSLNLLITRGWPQKTALYVHAFRHYFRPRRDDESKEKGEEKKKKEREKRVRLCQRRLDALR